MAKTLKILTGESAAMLRSAAGSFAPLDFRLVAVCYLAQYHKWTSKRGDTIARTDSD